MWGCALCSGLAPPARARPPPPHFRSRSGGWGFAPNSPAPGLAPAPPSPAFGPRAPRCALLPFGRPALPLCALPRPPCAPRPPRPLCALRPFGRPALRSRLGSGGWGFAPNAPAPGLPPALPVFVDAAGVGFPGRVLLFRVPSGRRALRPRGHCACPALLTSLRVLGLRFGARRVVGSFPSRGPCGLAGAFLLYPAALCACRLAGAYRLAGACRLV